MMIEENKAIAKNHPKPTKPEVKMLNEVQLGMMYGKFTFLKHIKIKNRALLVFKNI